MARRQKNVNAEVEELLSQILNNSNHPKDLNKPINVDAILHENILLGKIVTLLMTKEREHYLHANEEGDNANGFYPRKIHTKIAALPIEVPRTRRNGFRSSLLPDKYIRHEDSLEAFIKELLLSGLSKTKIKEVLHKQGVSVPEEAIDELSQSIENEFKQIVTKEIPEKLLFLFMDCKIVECVKENNRIGKMCIYQVYGVDMDGNKDILFFEPSEEPENAKKWIAVFSKMIERGLRKVFFIVSDNLTGIVDAIKNTMPDSLHQLCVVHLKRNIYKHLTRQHARDFCDHFNTIKSMNSYQDALDAFQNLCDTFMESYPQLMKRLKEQAPLYMNFIRLPRDVRKYVCSTNLVEGINNLIEQIRKSCGGYFRSSKHIYIAYAIRYNHLKCTKWSVPNPFVRANLRELIFAFNCIVGASL